MLNWQEMYEIIFSYAHIHWTLCLLTFLTSCLGDWGRGIRQRSFRKLLKSLEPAYKRGADPHKKNLYSTLNDATTPLTILEVGIGNGANFSFYPNSRPCHLIAVEPDQSCEKEIKKVLTSTGGYKNIHFQHFLAISAQDMNPIIPNDSVDVVMTTEAMCSIPSATKTLEEIHRVLKPGGRYYFFEHILDDPGRMWRKLQNFYLKTHIWQYGTAGCRFFEPEIILKFNGFSTVTATRTRIAFSNCSFHPSHLIAPHYYGIATKASSSNLSAPNNGGTAEVFEKMDRDDLLLVIP